MTIQRRVLAVASVSILLAACGGGGGGDTTDSTPPSAPSLTGTAPASPSSDLAPHLLGTAEAGATVRVYGAAACAGAVVATATASAAGTFDVAVAAAPDATTTFTATATDAAGNVSACSAGRAYVHDGLAPTAPVLTATVPAPPSSDAAPHLTGTAEAGATLRVFAQAGCAGAAVATLTVPAGGAFDVAAAATPDATTTFTATATDAAGNASACSAGLDYLHDGTAPAAPVLTASVPASPSSDAAPHLTGTAEAGATLRVYAQAACAGTAVATLAVPAGGAFDVAVAATPNATTSFSASATDAVGNASACSAPLAFVHDSVAPAAPVLAATVPASPSSDLAPHLTGTAEAGATLRVYAQAACAGTAVATLTVPAGGAFDVVVAVTPGATTTLTATATDAAGNASACSAGLAYLHDGIPPAAPVLTATVPASPSRDLAPHLLGTAEAGATLRVYAQAGCAGAVVATSTVPAGGAFDVTAAAAPDATTAFTATATDAAGNTSACSAGLSYLHDGTAPAAPVITASVPASPSGATTQPDFTGTAEPGAFVLLFVGVPCTGQPANAIMASGAGAFLGSADVAANATSLVYAMARDLAGNESACSAPFTFVHDALAPAAPVLTGTSPASPSGELNPHLLGTAEAGATLRVYAQAACAGTAVATLTVPAGGAFDVVVAVTPGATTTLTATATDAAGNASACSVGLDYLHDAQAPAAPVLTATVPASPSPSLTPAVLGTAEPGATVEVHGTPDCSGPVLGSDLAAGDGSFSIGVTVAANATTSLTATATAAGHVSGCSAPLDYRHDDIAPAAPVLTGSTPPSGGDANSPSIEGGGEPGARVALFTTADCTGPEAGSGVAAVDGSFAITVTVADNTTTTFRASQADAAGNGSACSATSVTYVEESRTLSVSPPTALVDRSPSPLDQQAFSYLLAGGPDAGVSWSVQEPGGGTISAGGLYTAPATPGTYHVVATTLGPLPPLTATATVTVRHPVVAGTVTYAGTAPGRLFVAVQGQFGGTPVGGTSLAVAGPGAYPFTVRGITSTGFHRVQAWFDATGVERLVPAADPYGEASVDLQGGSVTGLAITLTPPATLPPPTAAIQTVMPGDGMAVVLFDNPRDAQGRELADAYDVECTTGTPPVTPGPGAVRVPAGYDTVAFVYGLQNGVATTCSTWTERAGVLSAAATSAPFLPGPGAGGFSVSGTATLSGGAPGGPVFLVLFDPQAQVAYFQRYDAPAFPLAFTVPHVPAGTYGLGLIVDRDGDGRLGPSDLNTLSGGQPGFVTVAADVGGLALDVAWPDATAHAVVGHAIQPDGSESWELVLMTRSGRRLPATSVAVSGPDLPAPVDMGLSDSGGGSGVALTTVRGLGATPPAPGTYPFDVEYADGGTAQLQASVTAASLLEPPTPLDPVGGADALPQPTLTWAEPAVPPPGSYAYRLSVWASGGQWVWDTDSFPASMACSAGVCQVAWNFDGRAGLAALPPGDYTWEVLLQTASLDVARAQAAFHVPSDVTISPLSAALAPGAGQLFTATVTGTGSVSWSATCGTITPRADPLLADYLAPGSGPCTVTATSTVDAGRSASATVTVLAIPLTVVPDAVTLSVGDAQYFTASLGGPGAVTWDATCGTLAPTGDPAVVAWTAPASAGPCVVTATSTLQPGTTASATATVIDLPQLSIEPKVAVLNPGQRQPFVLHVAGTVQPASYAVIEPGGGTIDADGLYAAPDTLGTYHVVASDPTDPGRSRTAVVLVVSATTAEQISVAISPSTAATVVQGTVDLTATVTGCVDPSVFWASLDGGFVNQTGPATGTFQAPSEPGRYRVLAGSACAPEKWALAVVTVGLPSISGTVLDPVGGTGRLYVALLSTWGQVVAGTTLDAPGPFTLRGVRWPGSYSLWAWRDTLGTSKPSPRFEPFGVAAVDLPVGGSLAGADVTLAAPPTPVAPAALAGAATFAGDGAAVIFWNPLSDPATGEELADLYHVACDTHPTPGSPRAFTVTLADAKVVVLDGLPGSTWSCDLWASAGGLDGPPVSTGPFTLSSLPGGHAVSGEVTLTGASPGGPLFVALFSDALGLVPQYIGAPAFPQAFSLTGVPDGDWQLGAILDVNGDGLINRTDPNLFNGGAAAVSMAGADVGGLTLSLDLSDAAVAVSTRRSVGGFGESYAVQVVARSGRRVPVAAVLTGGPGAWAPVDMGMRINEGGDALEFGTSVELGATPPTVGDTYTVTVTFDDGTTADLQGAVTAILEPPVPLAPVDPLGTPLTAPAVPTFSWAPPAALPTGPYTYGMWMTSGGASWQAYDLPPSQLSVTYGTGRNQANPTELGTGTYGWSVSIRDQAGNEASQEAMFTVTP